MKELYLDTNVVLRYLLGDIPKLLKLFLLDKIKVMEVKKDILTKILERMQKQKIDFTDLYLAHSVPKQQIVSFDEDLKKYLIRNLP